MLFVTEENRTKCICPSCLSYPRICGGEILYCARARSLCKIQIKQCICNRCPVYTENRLTGLYFCDRDISSRGENLIRSRRENEDRSSYLKILHIKEIAHTGASVLSSMGSQKQLPFSFDQIHFLPAQLYRLPLERDDKIDTSFCLGPSSAKPLYLSSPIMISGMSLGAVSINLKLIFADVAADLGIAFNSGEGGILDEEIDKAGEHLIGQYCTVASEVDMERLSRVAAVEIRFGQGAYPGWESYLPPEKLSPEIARIRGLKGTEPVYSPAHHLNINNAQELKNTVEWLKNKTGGKPVGAKIGCGNVENDIGILISSGVDFIALDGFGGGTGATENFVRENTGIPIIAALPRAVKYLQDCRVKDRITLIAAGGLRTSADFAKCLALGADAVYIGTAALIAVNCEQYRVCHAGLCPTGITTHNPELTGQISVTEGTRKLANFIRVSTEEIANIARITGKKDIKELDSSDLISLNKDLADLTGIKWLDGSKQ